MASGSQVLKTGGGTGEVLTATITWTSTLISDNSHNLHFDIEIQRTDGYTAATWYWAHINGTEIGNTVNANCVANFSNNYTVSSDDSGIVSDSFTVKVRLQSSTSTDFTATYTFENLQLDRKLTIEQPSQATITVKKADVILNDGALIYPGDVLAITVEPNAGYDASLSVSGATGSDGNYTVTGNVTVGASTALTAYTLSISAGTGSSISVKKLSSPLASKDVNTIWTSGNATVYYDDVLQITFTNTSSEYKLNKCTVNDSDFVSGETYVVTENIAVVATAIKRGLVYVGNGSSFDPYLIYIGNGSDWDLYIPYIGNGSDWVICS